jgi:hypothetical protein
VWYASVAVQSMVLQRTLGVAELVNGQLETAVASAKALLDGVGQLPSSVEAHPLAVHYRRSLTDAEYSALPAVWCAIPAVHEGGRGMILEENI